jgi:hypothetical protein
MNIEPRGGSARLSLPREVHPAHHTIKRSLAIRIRKNDDGVLAAELKRYHLKMLRRGLSLDGEADVHASSERYATHFRVTNQAVTDNAAAAGDHVNDTGRKDFGAEFAQPKG